MVETCHASPGRGWLQRDCNTIAAQGLAVYRTIRTLDGVCMLRTLSKTLQPAKRAFWRAKFLIRPASLLICSLAPAILVAACSATPARVTFNAEDQAELAHISAYLDGLQRFTADFTQIGSQGAAKGSVWLDRPGRLRVEYYRPGPQTILAKRGRLLFVDHLTHATRELPISQTPLDILLSASIPLSGPVTVMALQHQTSEVLVTLSKTNAPAQGTLTLRFTEGPLTLSGVVIKDSTGAITALDLSNLVRDTSFGPDRFNYHPDPLPPET